ncbi:MAG: histidine kinase [Balneolaceae bacterium]|nr:histidine kinase [Balneolaceae bacterium]MBO6545441.1 histidine kinase [Balneolaceae bacterium]MBO6646837.1 histidine kinase [Balneolaceae bacterium]
MAKNRLLILHISFWAIFVFYRLFDYTRYIPLETAVNFLAVPLIFNILASYLHYFFVLPYLIQTQEYVKYFTFLVLTLIVVMGFRFIADNYFMAPFSQDQEYYASIHFPRVLSVLWGFLTFIIFTGMIKFTSDWFRIENEKKQLENEKLTAELNYLKAQINPHFLFNTLHNLNYLVQGKKDEAAQIIIRLSNIMRYMIYDANQTIVPITKEIQYMQDYIELERIRLNNPLDISFNISGNYEQTKIAPLILITFLENAFKHGVSDEAENCWIKVDLQQKKEILTYSVSNSKIEKTSSSERSGFGLGNLEKRLKLHYPEKHQLLISESEHSYNIKLILAFE